MGITAPAVPNSRIWPDPGPHVLQEIFKECVFDLKYKAVNERRERPGETHHWVYCKHVKGFAHYTLYVSMKTSEEIFFSSSYQEYSSRYLNNQLDFTRSTHYNITDSASLFKKAGKKSSPSTSRSKVDSLIFCINPTPDSFSYSLLLVFFLT